MTKQPSRPVADWSSRVETGEVLRHDDLVFYNNRWAGEHGSINVRFGPPACTWWTTHEGPVDPSHPVSSPWASFGNDWGNVSEHSPLPIRLGDLEVLRASLSATLPREDNGRLLKDMPSRKGPPIVPAGTAHMFRVCWQLYFSDNPEGANYNRGDFAPTVYAVNCSPTWWGTDAGTFEADGRRWKMCDSQFSSRMGRYIIPLLEPYLTPDAGGTIEIRDVDIKAMIDWSIAKGFHRPEHYLVFVGTAWEIWIQDQTMVMNDMGFLIKAKGKPAVTVPPWSTMASPTSRGARG